MAVIALEEKKHYAGANKLDFENHLEFASGSVVPKSAPEPVARSSKPAKAVQETPQVAS